MILDFLDPNPEGAARLQTEAEFLALSNRISVYVPFVNTINPELADQLSAFRAAGIEVVPIRTSAGFVEITRAHAIHLFLEESDRDFFLFLDADIIPDHVETPWMLAAHNLPLVAGWAAVLNPTYGLTTNFVTDRLTVSANAHRIIPPVGLIRVDWVGCGMMMLRRDLLAKIDKPFLLPDNLRVESAKTGRIDITEDHYFCRQVRAAGESVVVDLAVTAGHLKTQPIRYPAELIRQETPLGKPNWANSR